MFEEELLLWAIVVPRLVFLRIPSVSSQKSIIILKPEVRVRGVMNGLFLFVPDPLLLFFVLNERLNDDVPPV